MSVQSLLTALVSTTKRRLVWVVAAVVLFFGFVVQPATAESDEPTVVETAKVVSVDASSGVGQAAVFSTYGPEEPVKIDVSGVGTFGEEAAQRSDEAGVVSEVVFVIDLDQGAAAGEVFENIKETIATSIEAMPEGTAVGAVAAADSSLVISKVTTDREAVIREVRSLTVRSSTNLDRGIQSGAKLFSSDVNLRSIVAVSTGSPSSAAGEESTGDPAFTTRAAIAKSGAQLIAVQYLNTPAKQSAGSTLRQSAIDSGGTEVRSTQPGSVVAAVERGAALAATRIIVPMDLEGQEVGQQLNASLSIGGEKVDDLAFMTGQRSAGISDLKPVIQPASDSPFLSGPVALTFLVLLAFVGIALAVWAGSAMFLGSGRLENLLDRYEAHDPTLSEEEKQEAVVQTAVLQRAVQMSENFADQRGVLTRIEGMLEKASLPIRAGEAVVFFGVAMLFSLAVSWFLIGPIGAIFAIIIIPVLAFFALQFLARRRLKKFESQLPDMLQLLAGTLRAGFSLPQGIEAVSEEMASPISDELRRAVTEARLGRDLEDALEGVGDRVASPDFAWAVMAIGIQRQVGGNLNELLMTVSDTMVARERLRREVSALTAEGRMSAIILGLMPPGLSVVLFIGNPEYIGKLFEDGRGNIMLGVAVLMTLIGLAWMKKVITLDV